jgi:uncharacterized protein YjbI with pentapeptide repeats
MTERFRSWWQKRRKLPLMTGIIALFVGAIVLIWASYANKWSGTGFSNKTLWDWLQLLIIPFALALIAIFFNRAERKNEQSIASDNQQEAALQEYIKEMSELLLHEELRESQPEDEVRTIARVRTLTVVSRLDNARKGRVLQFLFESKLIDSDRSIVALRGTDLRGADLADADLSGANLSMADLSEANLSRANLSGANLSAANLYEADLSGANLTQAILREATGYSLNKAKLTDPPVWRTVLSRADLRGAELPNADLGMANLSEADLSGAILIEADLSLANLSGANLSEADLRRADLSKANLKGARVTGKQLDRANLKDATMPNGTKHD